MMSGSRIRRQAGCMAKVEKRRRATHVPKQVSIAIEAAADKKANDLVVLDLRKATGFTDFFVICSGTNPRQIRAIADSVTEALAASGAKPAHVEGYERSEWILLDYFDFIVHVFGTGDTDVLRPRASVGQRRTHRNQRNITTDAAVFRSGFWTQIPAPQLS